MKLNKILTIIYLLVLAVQQYQQEQRGQRKEYEMESQPLEQDQENYTHMNPEKKNSQKTPVID